jgi:hypothetical protein
MPELIPHPLPWKLMGRSDRRGKRIIDANQRTVIDVIIREHGAQIVTAVNAHDAMLALLKEYVAEDPCAAGDPRYLKAVELIEKIEPKKGRLFGPCDPQGPAGPEAFNHDDCAYFNDLSGETCYCDCHTPSDIKIKLQRLKERGIILSPELEERLRP